MGRSSLCQKWRERRDGRDDTMFMNRTNDPDDVQTVLLGTSELYSGISATIKMMKKGN